MATRKKFAKVEETVLTNSNRGNDSIDPRSVTLTPRELKYSHHRSLRPPQVNHLRPVSPCRQQQKTPPVVMTSQSKRKKDARMRRIQAMVYDFLERPKDYKSVGYQLVMFLMALLCLLLSVLSTVDKYETIATDILIGAETVMVIWFSTEFIMRLWSAGCRSRFQNLQGRLQFLRRPLCLLDAIIIMASLTILCFGSEGQIFTTSALGGLRFFQILRMLRIDRRGGSWKLLGSVIWAHRQELFTTLYIGFLGLIFFSFLIYIVEKDRNPARFGTYPDALWWGVVTLCTVGYGDAVPVTWLGKLVASCCALLGISFFALPAGILGSGFALKVQQQQRQKHLTRRKGPAAVLIQSLWRCHAGEESFNSVATWLVHVQRLSPKTSVVSASGSCQKFRMNSSFISRLSIRRKEGYAGNHHLHGNNNNTNNNNNANNTNNNNNNNNVEEGKRNIIRRTYSGNNADPSSRYSNFNSRSKLKRSHISFQDVVVLQSSPVGDNAVKKDDDVKNEDSNEDILHCSRVDHLTPTHKVAIRAIRKIKFFVARRIFKEALKPYDVKDVIEQYTAGHLDMLTRVKDLQTRLDLIIGQSGSASPEINNRVSMAARVIKIEKQISCIESKLDSLVELHHAIMRSSTHTNSLPSNQSSECNDGDQSRRLSSLGREFRSKHHERAYKQLSEPLSSSESMMKEHHLTVGQFNKNKRSIDLSGDRLHFLGSHQSIDPLIHDSNKLRWGHDALLEAFGSRDIIRSEMMLNRIDHFDSEIDEKLVNKNSEIKTNFIDNSLAAINLSSDIPPSLNELEDQNTERQTLYTLSEHTSATSTTWSASTDPENKVTIQDLDKSHGSFYENKVRDEDLVKRSQIETDNGDEEIDTSSITPDIIDSNEYEPLLPVGEDSPNVIRNKCTQHLDASKIQHGRYKMDIKNGGQNKLAAIPLLNPLFIESPLNNQCPSIFLTMPSNERISSIEDRENFLDDAEEKCLATISRSISALCSLDELL